MLVAEVNYFSNSGTYDGLCILKWKVIWMWWWILKLNLFVNVSRHVLVEWLRSCWSIKNKNKLCRLLMVSMEFLLQQESKSCWCWVEAISLLNKSFFGAQFVGRVGFQRKHKLISSHSTMTGHVIDKCYKQLHCYPLGYKPGPFRSNSSSANQLSGSDFSYSENESILALYQLSISKEQCDQLI